MPDQIVQALGRPASLGQLYDARSSNLLQQTLFNTADMKPIRMSIGKTEATFKEDKTIRERRESLDVNASVSLSILGGMVKVRFSPLPLDTGCTKAQQCQIKGFGSYLDRSDESEESTTISAIARIRTFQDRLDLLSLQNAVALSPAAIQKSGATHCITAITYGGAVLGTLSEKQANKDKSTDVHGKFSLDILKSLGALASAKGTAEVISKEQDKVNSFNLTVTLTGDFRSLSENIPVTPVGMIDTVSRATSLIGDGVPLELYMTPLTQFDMISTVQLSREFAETDIMAVTDFYDDLITLQQSRTSLFLKLNGTNDGVLFPSLLETCRAQSLIVSRYLAESRGKLGAFLARYRNSSPETNSETAASFLSDGLAFLNEQRKLFDKHNKKYIDFQT